MSIFNTLTEGTIVTIPNRLPEYSLAELTNLKNNC